VVAKQCELCNAPIGENEILCTDCDECFMDLCELNGLDTNSDAMKNMSKFYYELLGDPEE
jgi:hypothetical protein